MLLAPLLLVAAAGAAPAPPLTLEKALAMAVETNPDVLAARLEIPISEAAVRSARELPNPTVTGSYGADSPQVTAGVEQRIPILGQHASTVRAAEAGREVSLAKLPEAVAKARAAVRRAFAATFAAQQRVEIAADVRQLGEALARAAQLRLEHGAGSELDFLQASLAQRRREQEVIDRRAELEAQRAALAATLGSAPGDLGPLTAPGPGAGPLAVEELLERAARHPRLRVLDAELRAALAAADREGAAAVPVPALSLEYERLPDLPSGYGLRAGITFDLPVWSWNVGAVQGQRARAKQLEAEREVTARRLLADLAAAASKHATGAARAQRYQATLVPEARRIAQMSQLAYQEGKAPLVTALQAQIDLADVRDQAADAARDAEIARADLEEALGEPL